MIWFLAGQRYKGRFICNGSETDIRECQISFYPVVKCTKGELMIYCDTSKHIATYVCFKQESVT